MKPLIGITGDIEKRDSKTYLYIDLRYGKMVEEAGVKDPLISRKPRL